MKRVTLIGLALGSTFVCSGQQPNNQIKKQIISFEQALQLTLAQNPQILASHYEELAAEQEKKAAFGLRLPQVGMTAAYAHMGSDIGIDFNTLKAPIGGILGGMESILPPPILQQAAGLLGKNWEYTIQDRNLGTIATTITLPIYTGGKINAANNAAKIKMNLSREQGTQSRNALVSELTERYFGLSLALQVVEVRAQVLTGMRHHLTDAQALEQNGIISRGERLYAEVHAAEAEREYLKAMRQAETLNAALGNTLNESGDFSPISSLFILKHIEEVSYYKALATKHNPLLKQVSLQRDLAQEAVRLQRSEFLPQVALMGAASLYNYQVSPIIPRWAVGAGVKINIFDGLHREHKYSAARNQVRQVGALQTKAGNDILTLIEKLYNEMTTYRDQLPSIDASWEFSREYLRIKEEAFKEGAAPSSDVVDAQLNFAKIKTERLQTAYYYDLMLARLLEACGVSEDFGAYSRRETAMPVRFSTP